MAHYDNHPSVKEPDLYERIRWLSSEFLVQAGRFRDAASILERMRTQGSRAGVEAALESISKIHDQTSGLISSLERAIAGRDATGKQVHQGRVS